MSDARLEVNDGLGRRIVPITKGHFAIGRRETNDLRLAGSDVSREHAEIVVAGRQLRPARQAARATAPSSTASRSPSTSWRTATGSGSAARGGADVVFLTGDAPPPVERAHADAPSTTCARWRRCSRACARSARAACSTKCSRWCSTRRSTSPAPSAASSCWRRPTSELEFKLARAQGPHHAARQQLRDQPQDSRGSVRAPASSRSSPTCSTATSPTCTWAPWRSASATSLCVPLRSCATSIAPTADGEDQTHRRALPRQPREGQPARAAHARRARHAGGRSRRGDRERAALPRDAREGADRAGAADRGRDPAGAAARRHARAAPFFEAAARRCRAGRSAATSSTTSTCPTASFGFPLGDVAGKGPPAALLSAKMQGIFSAFAGGRRAIPSQTVDAHQQGAVPPRHRAALRDADVRQLSADGQLMFCNAGHNPPLVYGKTGLRRLEAGGMPVGLFEFAPYSTSKPSRSSPATRMVVFSDGVTEAQTASPARSSARARIVEVRAEAPSTGSRRQCSSRSSPPSDVRARRRAVRRHHGAGDELHRDPPGRAARRMGAGPAGSSSRVVVWNGVFDCACRASRDQESCSSAGRCAEPGRPAPPIASTMAPSGRRSVRPAAAVDRVWAGARSSRPASSRRRAGARRPSDVAAET